MATNPSNSGSLFRPRTYCVQGNLGEYNRVVELVPETTTFSRQDLNEGSGFIVNGTTCSHLTFSNGGRQW